ncbi:hypothetical protein, partial [Psychrobacter sp. AOP7-B1-24]|uniref:hypothetical protein n=1 Tax=Psychrobacter sp. AOP7-B1-24 TaxID=3457645 RepID=UPI00402BA274
MNNDHNNHENNKNNGKPVGLFADKAYKVTPDSNDSKPHSQTAPLPVSDTQSQPNIAEQPTLD